MASEPALRITFEPFVSNTDTLINQFWKCLNTRLDLGEEENYVTTSRDFSKKGPHFLLFLSVCRPKDCFEHPFKAFKDQVPNIDSHVYLIILLKPGQILNDMEHFDRGFGFVKKIYLEDRCILDEGDTKTIFNELAESLKSKYRFKARDTWKQNSHMDDHGKSVASGGVEDQLEPDQRNQEEGMTDYLTQHQPEPHGKLQISGKLSITITEKKQGFFGSIKEKLFKQEDTILDVNVSESGTTIIEGIFKFKPDFKKESCPVLGDPRHITQTVINELERYFIGKLTPDEVESIVTKLKRTHGLAPGAMENFM